jgi:hypothetical protein
MRSLLADRRLVAAAVLVVAAIVATALLGRWERSRWVRGQLRGQERIVRLVGPLDQHDLIGFRVLPQFDCLVYRRGSELLALELCVDRRGRLIEAIDRRRGARRYYDLESDPGAATVRLDRANVDRLLRKMGAE